MARIMKLSASASALLTTLFAVLHRYTHIDILLVPAITFGTTTYHLAMRLLVGFLIDCILHNRVDYHRKWFGVSPMEQKIYRLLNVKKWKGKMATYDPSVFDPTKHSWAEIAQATCQAELVHEIIIVLSFVPLFAAIPFGEPWAFIATSICAAIYDALFVIMQRYNRPRIIKLIR